MDGHFIKSSVEEFSLDCGGKGVWQEAALRLDTNHTQAGLFARDENTEVERMFRGPGDQFLRRITPAESKGRLDNPLGAQLGCCEAEEYRDNGKHGLAAWFGGREAHKRSLIRSGDFRKQRRTNKGFALVEATMAMALLSVTGLLLLTLSLNVIQPRQYSLQQILSDSYLTFERAQAERIPFGSLLANDSPWPVSPAVSNETVEIGKLPGGRAVTGVVTRTRTRDANNLAANGGVGVGTLATNPASMEIWRVQSILRYEISGRTYVKSRTVVRAQ